MEGDTTLVTGASGGRVPRRGDVLAERYEIVEALAADPLVCTYRGVDQETDAPVLVRCSVPGLLGEKDARRMVERVRALIGGGGRVLSPLREVDREGTVVLTVEPWPRGTSLRAVLDARRAKGAGTLEPHEVLPVIARLAAALESIPSSSWHGDVRAERLWLDPDGLVLTGGFLLSSLPGDAVAGVLAEDLALRRLFAPEVGDGLGGRASDRWGAAAIVWEALTGDAIVPGPIEPPASLGAVGPALVRMLHPDPAGRPSTLDALIGEIAELARLPVPRVELDAFPPPSASDDGDSDEPTQVAEVAEVASDTERPPPRASSIPAPRVGSTSAPRVGSIPAPGKGLLGQRKPVRPALLDAPTVRTTEMSFDGGDDEMIPTDPRQRALVVSSDDTAPHAALGADGKPPSAAPHAALGAEGKPPSAGRGDDLDPRLVRAALAPGEQTLESTELELVDTNGGAKKPAADGLDPRLVRAALGMSSEDSSPPVPRGRAPGPKKSSAVTQELDAADLQEIRASVPKKAAAPIASAQDVKPAARGRAARPRRDPEPVPLPTDIKGIPRPREDESGEMSAGPVLFDASKPAPRASPPPPMSLAAMAPFGMPPAPGPSIGLQPASPPMATSSPMSMPMPMPAAGAAFPPPRSSTDGPTSPRLSPAPIAPRLSPAPIAPRAERPTPGGAPAWASWAIVAMALLLGLLIVGAGFWYRASLQRDADRQQRIEQRLRELQSEP